MTKTEQMRLASWRLKVLQRATDGSGNVARTCRHFGISRTAFYKWKKRFDEHGAAGLGDRPRAPHHSPRATPREVVSKNHVLAQMLRLDRSLVLTSREFDFVPEGLPPHVRYVGPQPDDPAGLDACDGLPVTRSRDPLVLVSLGTTYQRQEKTFSRTVDALGMLPVRGLATYGAIDPPAGAARRTSRSCGRLRMPHCCRLRPRSCAMADSAPS